MKTKISEIPACGEGNTYRFADDTVIEFRRFFTQAGNHAIAYRPRMISEKLHHVKSFRAAIRREEKKHGKVLKCVS